jgi:hypothetical protein
LWVVPVRVWVALVAGLSDVAVRVAVSFWLAVGGAYRTVTVQLTVFGPDGKSRQITFQGNRFGHRRFAEHVSLVMVNALEPLKVIFNELVGTLAELCSVKFCVVLVPPSMVA